MPERKPDDVLETISRDKVKFIDLQFTDIPGRLQHTTIISDQLNLEAFEEGVPKLDGSSIRGFVSIHESDLVLKPDPSTFAVIPWTSPTHGVMPSNPDHIKTARMICDVYWGGGRGRLEKDSRAIAQRAEEALVKLGHDFSYWGPEVEFFVFDKVSWDVLSPYQGQSYRVESREAAWSTVGGYPIRFKEGYFPAPPQDTLMEYRSECVRVLEETFDVRCDAHHHEVATAGQCEIDMCRDGLTRMGDNVMTYKYVVKNVAKQMGMTATMMPKPLFGDNGSGMHVHVSVWRGDVNLFYDQDESYAELSQLGRYFGGGLLEHSCSLAAIVAPTTNSYKRLVPGYEAPVYVAWSRGNRSANLRVPVYRRGPRAAGEKRLEFRPPDPACNPYLCFAAMLAAGIDGIKKKVDMGDPVDEDIYKLTPERRRQLGIKELPGSLKEAVGCLQSDSEYLKPIFPGEAVEEVVENELREAKELALRPHPYEFYLYYDV